MSLLRGWQVAVGLGQGRVWKREICILEEGIIQYKSLDLASWLTVEQGMKVR